MSSGVRTPTTPTPVSPRTAHSVSTPVKRKSASASNAATTTSIAGGPPAAPARLADGVHDGVYNGSMDANIGFSSRAAHKVRELIDDEGNPALKLRVFITGGGCSGFSYGFTFDDGVADDDAVIVRDGVTAVVDPMSYQYLAGAEIDYREDLSGAQFIVANPNASSTCGCGNSFAI